MQKTRSIRKRSEPRWKLRLCLLLTVWLGLITISPSYAAEIKLFDGKEWICYDEEEQSELVGILAGCTEMQKQLDTCLKEQVTNVTILPGWAWFAVGLIAGGLVATTVAVVK
jgi:hypothetical protein